MKKILLSLATILVVGGLVAGATTAFFSDTETSSGNIFVAGAIDLKVDHTRQTYNGVDCATCDVLVVSDTSNMVVAKNGTPVTPYNASVVTTIHPAWTASIDGADWIWATNPVTQEDVVADVTYTFQKEFTWFGPFTAADVDFSVASDNSYEVWLNGNLVHADTAENNFSSVDDINVDLTSFINQGNNVLTFVVKNFAMPAGNPASNPAGVMYKVHIDGDCGNNYFLQHCSLFGESDLVDHTFFNFDDIKPGDFGTNVISLHVYDNDAWGCFVTTDKHDYENTLLDPETTLGDLGPANEENGELSQYLTVFVWQDTNGDGIYDAPSETPVGISTLGDMGDLGIFDSSTSGIAATETEYVGFAWCAGTISADNTTGEISCNGDTMLNDAQSDSFTATLTAYAVQQRNNSEFVCSSVDLTPLP